MSKDDDILDEIRSILTGRKSGQYGEKDPGLPPMEPRFVHDAFRRFRRGGLPSSSMPEPISGSRNSPMVVTQPTNKKGDAAGPVRIADATDADIEADKSAYSRLIADALSHLRMARTIENRWRLIAGQLEPEPIVICSNPKCAQEAERGRTQCARCRKWPQRNDGLEFPQRRGDVRTEKAS